jgi:type I restriction enzyme S subunit
MTDVQFISPEFHDSLKKSQLRRGDLLIVRVGANRGDACVVPDGLGKLNCANIVFARPLDGLSPFLGLYFLGPGRDRLLAETTGSAQGVINTQAVAATRVPLPSVTEQHEIVRRVVALMRRADAIEKGLAVATARADKLRQAILAKALRGELVPTEAELARREGRGYEPATDLLKRICVHGR